MDNEPFNEQGTGKTGTVYRVAASEGCRSKLPGMAGQAILVADGKIYRRIADPARRRRPARRSAGCRSAGSGRPSALRRPRGPRD